MDRFASLHLTPKRAAYTRFHAEADRSVVESIRSGVLFVMAFWSGPAFQTFAELKRVLEVVDPDCRLELVVVDTDGSDGLQELSEFHGKLHGAGETVWVHEGRIIHSSGLGFHPECFEPFTRELLARCEGVPRSGQASV